jgi:hypothetical protein
MNSPIVIDCRCHERPSGGSVPVLKAGVVPDLMSGLWTVLDSFSDKISKAWLKAIIIDPKELRITSVEELESVLARLDKRADEFTSSPIFDDFEELVGVAYATGALLIRARKRGEKGVRRGWAEKMEPLPPFEKMEPLPPLRKKLDDVPIEISDFDFSLSDERALTQLRRHSTLWIRDGAGRPYSSPAVSRAIRERASQMVDEGLDPEFIGQELLGDVERIYGVGSFSDKSAMYWGGVVDYAGTISAVRGQVNTMVDLGVERYEIVNPMDERTTPICQQLNGKVYLVDRARDHFNRLDGATTVDEVKAIKGFTGRLPDSLTLPTGSDPKSIEERSGELSRLGLLVPPFHFRCRSFLDISEV